MARRPPGGSLAVERGQGQSRRGARSNDGRRFDQLARALGRQSSRRDGIKVLAAAASAALFGTRAHRTASATVGWIEPGNACDGDTEPFGCCEEAVCLFVAEREFRCCIPAGSDARCDEDRQCCSGACNDNDMDASTPPGAEAPRGHPGLRRRTLSEAENDARYQPASAGFVGVARRFGAARTRAITER